MRPAAAQNLLSASYQGRRVTIGLETPEELRVLSDTRALTCPCCGAQVILHAGTVLAHHFAHLPGAVCRLPQTEPETEEHRSGKLLLAQWLRERLPDATITVEAWLPATGQRADVLLEHDSGDGTLRRVALEYQCANLSEREWRRRHGLYRESGLEDLWFLGGSRFHKEALDAVSRSSVVLRTGELERALLRSNAPLLFLDAASEQFQAGMLVRFRPSPEAQALRPAGKLSARPLRTLDFPWPLLDWPQAGQSPELSVPRRATLPERAASPTTSTESRLWMWLEQRHHVTRDTLPAFFGLPIKGQEAFACEARLWQAAVYYRFIHRNVGDGWWLPTVETWSRACLPLVSSFSLRQMQAALRGLQEAFAAAEMLSLPMGHKRLSARVTADLTTLNTLPDRDEILRLIRYRRTLLREANAEYQAAGE